MAPDCSEQVARIVRVAVASEGGGPASMIGRLRVVSKSSFRETHCLLLLIKHQTA